MQNELDINQRYFEFSQAVKIEIEGNPLLISRVKGYFSGEISLNQIAGSEHHILYSVGRLDSGLWIAIRKNHSLDDIIKENPKYNSLLMYIYEDYCLKAEGKAGWVRHMPKFTVGGCIGCVPFLLTEDMSEGKKYPTYSTHIVGPKAIHFRKKDDVEEEIDVDFGLESLIGIDWETKDALCSGKFDENNFRYFNPKARLNIL